MSRTRPAFNGAIGSSDESNSLVRMHGMPFVSSTPFTMLASASLAYSPNTTIKNREIDLSYASTIELGLVFSCVAHVLRIGGCEVVVSREILFGTHVQVIMLGGIQYGIYSGF